MKIVETTTSFLLFKVFISIVAFPLTNVAFNITQVLGFIFFSHFCSIDIGSWVASLPMMFVLVFFGGLDLRLTCIISGSRVFDWLNLVFILMISLSWLDLFFLVALWLFGYLKSISFILEDGLRLVFTSTLMAFSTISSYKSRSHP